MEKKLYIKPESVVVPYVDHLMHAYDDLTTSPYDAFARENDTFFDDDADYELWSDFVPFEEEE